MTLDGASLSDDRVGDLDARDGAPMDAIEDANDEEMEEEPLLPRATPPLTRARARLLGQSVLVFEQSPPHTVTLLQVKSELASTET